MQDTLAPFNTSSRSATSACPACGTPRPGRYCPSCGQHARERLNTDFVVRKLLTDALGVNRGLLHTFVSLLRDPGRVVRHYIAGHTVSYTNPASYLLLCASITAVLLVSSGSLQETVVSFNEGLTDGNVPATLPNALSRIVAHASLFVALGIPLTALISRMTFARSGHNFAEHLVFNAYLLSHIGLVLALTGMLQQRFLQSGGAADVVLTLATALLVLGYYARAAIRVFGEPVTAGVLRSAVVLLLAMFCFISMLGLVAAAAALLAQPAVTIPR